MQQSQSHEETCRGKNQIVTELACIKKRRLLTLSSSRLDEAMGKQLPFSDIAVVQQKGNMVWPLQASVLLVALSTSVQFTALIPQRYAAGRLECPEAIEVARSPGSLIPDWPNSRSGSRRGRTLIAQVCRPLRRQWCTSAFL